VPVDPASDPLQLRIDIVSIFPDYLAPLQLSLVGRAAASGLVALGVHDLRRWTSDRHRTVDDTPYGGGAGMVMMPEPWGRALDDLVQPDSRLLIMSPSGRPFTQALAVELAAEAHLILACGRYEGIDARVAEDARTRGRVDEISIGDYVLNGGEAAALVITEAVVRLLPGVIGNPASLAEESYAATHDGLLEYPLYTKPPLWRDRPVPEVLFSGHHAAIAAWRRDQALARTIERRPDLVLADPPPADLSPVIIGSAGPADAGELLTLQRAAFLSEGQPNSGYTIPPLVETLDDVRMNIAAATVLVARRAGRLIGAVLGEVRGDAWYIGRLMVAPDLQGHSLGGRLLTGIEERAPAETRVLRLLTGGLSGSDLAFFQRRGYAEVSRSAVAGQPEVVVLERPRPGISPSPAG
jgi:tRNA (guanine37-N1)-methyltransferase